MQFCSRTHFEDPNSTEEVTSPTVEKIDFKDFSRFEAELSAPSF
jgi:hypothetical protein